MSFSSTGKLSDLGTIIEPASNAVFSVENPQKVWVVLAGTLDLFLIDVGDDASTGPRSHILRVVEGGGVFGFSPRQEANGPKLIANPGPETTLLCLDKAQLEPLSNLTEAHPLLPILEHWIGSLSTVALEGIPPKFFTKLERGRQIQFGDGGGSVLAFDQVLWILPVEGSARFLGSETLPALDARHYFPVARGAWLSCAPHTRLDCIDSQRWLQQDPQWSALHAFSDLIRSWLVLQQNLRQDKENRRMLASAEADELRVERALLTLATPLERSERVSSDTGTTGDPLLQACEAVGRAAGIKIQAPLASAGALKQRDPVGAIARASCVRVRTVLLRAKWWKQDNGPLLAFIAADKRPVALLPRSSTSYSLFDPALPGFVDVTEKVAGELGGMAYVFYRSFPVHKIKIKDLLRFVLPGSGRDLARMVLMGIAAGLLALLPPIFIGIVFDDIIPGAQQHALVQVTVFLVVSAFAVALFSLSRQLAMLRMEGKMDAATQAAVWDRTVALPVPFFRDYTAGDLAMRGLVIGQIRQILFGSSFSSIISGIFSIFSFALLFYYSWELALLVALLTGISVMISSACGYFQLKYQREVSRVRGRISGMVLQFIAGISKFRVSGTETRVFGQWAREFTKQKLIYFRARKISNSLAVFNAAFPVIAYAAIFYWAADLFSSPVPRITSGQFLAFFAASVQFLAATQGLTSAVLSAMVVIPLWQRAQPILETLPEVDPHKVDPGELSGRIEVNHVVFRYRKDLPIVIDDVSFSVSPGEFVAFVGMSGSGKSTLFRLLLGFERPESGAIYFDGQELASLDLQAVRRQLGVVLQNARLLTGDILTNIVGPASLTVDDAWEAARLCGLDRDIEAMPMGMYTVVSEGGGAFSGGQRQRLMIARAVVGKPRILLFDEATSALDNETQALVSKSLENLNATRIVIAHRLTTVIGADRIFVMHKGRIEQVGTYAELMRDTGMFAQLAKRQLN
jgi:NHLM bacteriocin system ABC transporter ATP-binding protein